VSALGEVQSELLGLRVRILEAGWVDPAGLVRKARDFLGAIAEEREPTAGELLQAAALLSVAAEVRLLRTEPPDPNGSDPPSP